ncbi:glutaredoxin 3 [Solemya pervernicosa gill symbiont]|uniref:Glutaredoxin n=2 Tax=Gammaproteobacteria incertae sedis TaxID=118884 RepID=A0A1T2L3E9_9GAMM|nr:glutaredoxin 3 [Candidatus Reidiella endopervernicosa]OOZ39621.1 glutaredoxin 3 [Solemya pervernicosa gill symbiont]QKQ25448.1 glutaredoxin 3 [Candidatus Reidiella endopervernicosa]
MANVVIYSTGSCPYCVRARMLLEKKGISFEEFRIDEKPELRPEMERLSGRDSVPQIFIDERRIGGFDDMYELDMDDELDPLLGLS